MARKGEKCSGIRFISQVQGVAGIHARRGEQGICYSGGTWVAWQGTPLLQPLRPVHWAAALRLSSTPPLLPGEAPQSSGVERQQRADEVALVPLHAALAQAAGADGAIVRLHVVLVRHLAVAGEGRGGWRSAG